MIGHKYKYVFWQLLRGWRCYVVGAARGQVLRDWSASMYKAGLVPAANVHLGTPTPHDGPLLRPEVAALQGPPPPFRGFARKQLPDASPVEQVSRPNR